MRTCKRLSISLLAGAAAAVGVTLFWPAPYPVGLRCVSMQPSGSGIMDDNDAELAQVTLAISNRSTRYLFFPGEWIRVEAKIGGRWIETDNRCSLTSLKPAGEADLQLLVPPNSEGCRCRLKYVPESLESRVVARLWRSGIPIPAYFFRCPPEGRNPRWRQIMPEVIISPNSTRRHGITGGAQRPVCSGRRDDAVFAF